MSKQLKPLCRTGWTAESMNVVWKQRDHIYSTPVTVNKHPTAKARDRHEKFWRMTYGEKVEVLAKAICDHSRNWPGAWDNDTPKSARLMYRLDARAALAAMGVEKEKAKK